MIILDSRIKFIFIFYIYIYIFSCVKIRVNSVLTRTLKDQVRVIACNPFRTTRFFTRTHLTRPFARSNPTPVILPTFPFSLFFTTTWESTFFSIPIIPSSLFQKIHSPITQLKQFYEGVLVNGCWDLN